MSKLQHVVVALVASVLLTGCATEGIRLRHPTSGDQVQCGPYSYWPSMILAEIRIRDCVKDYQRAGYDRMP